MVLRVPKLTNAINLSRKIQPATKGMVSLRIIIGKHRICCLLKSNNEFSEMLLRETRTSVLESPKKFGLFDWPLRECLAHIFAFYGFFHQRLGLVFKV